MLLFLGGGLDGRWGCGMCGIVESAGSGGFMMFWMLWVLWAWYLVVGLLDGDGRGVVW